MQKKAVNKTDVDDLPASKRGIAQFRKFSRQALADKINHKNAQIAFLKGALNGKLSFIPKGQVFHNLYIMGVIIKGLKPKQDNELIFWKIDMACAIYFMHLTKKDFVQVIDFIRFCRRKKIPLTHKPKNIFEKLSKMHLVDEIPGTSSIKYYLTHEGRTIGEDINYLRTQISQVKEKAKKSKMLWPKSTSTGSSTKSRNPSQK